MSNILRLGTRESHLAMWQAMEVDRLLQAVGVATNIVPISSEGDINLHTPLYEMGVQGIFTRSLDASLLSGAVDIAVHSYKDVPTQLAKGIVVAAVLPRASFADVFVPREDTLPADDTTYPFVVATSSIRRKAQWLHRYPNTTVENLRGNVNTRLRKVAESNWHGAIFAAAGLERIGVRPATAIDLGWMLPAPAQGAIVVVCREGDASTLEKCSAINHADTAICTAVERQFLTALMGGCATPISALATLEGDRIHFKGNMLSPDGQRIAATSLDLPVADWSLIGAVAAK
ncbi:MAG: hydroxymethylbilane synthase, partial [Chitinophagia bacterium]|nr:hydroxymethylbilane synthase [Chitinophagia bacterium]